MVTNALLDYIRQQRQSGVTDEALRAALLSGGWNLADADEAFLALQSPGQNPVASTPESVPVTPAEALPSAAVTPTTPAGENPFLSTPATAKPATTVSSVRARPALPRKIIILIVGVLLIMLVVFIGLLVTGKLPFSLGGSNLAKPSPTLTPTATPPAVTISVTPNPLLDRDNDGLPDVLEAVYGTDPLNPDTDGDGYKDGSEVCDGYNPLGPGLMPESMKNYPKPACPVAVAPPPSLTGPIQDFAAVFAADNYKITTTGIISNQEAKDPNTSGGMTSSSTKVDLTNSVFYYQKGVVVRGDMNSADLNGGTKQEVVFLKDTSLFYLDVAKKTFTRTDPASSVGKMMLGMLQNSLPLNQLLKEARNKDLAWTSVGANTWQTDWNYASDLLDLTKTVPVKLKIVLEPTTKLISQLSIQFAADKPWQDVKMQYAKTGDVNSYLTVPAGYTEQQSLY